MFVSIPSNLKRLLFLFLWTGCLSLAAQSIEKQSIPTEHQWLYGVGHAHVLDTYLSPMAYAGVSLGVWHRSERRARWGNGRVTVQGLYGGNFSKLSAQADADSGWDGFMTVGGGWHYNWKPRTGMRLALGGLAELGAGFTYYIKGGNNPAQGRLSVQLATSVLLEQEFRCFSQKMKARWQMDVPLVGAMFTPDFGQSYYEIFTLGHYSHNVKCTSLLNAPMARLQTLLDIPVGRATLTVGYWGDIRQSDVNHLKHHAWKHYFVVGYTRRLQLLR